MSSPQLYNNEVTEENDRGCTFGEMALEWMDQKKSRIKESTYSVYYQCVHRHLIPQLGDVPIGDMTEAFLSQFLCRQQQTGGLKEESSLSWKTISDMRSILQMILHYAGIHGYPALKSIHLELPPRTRVPPETLTKSEQDRLEKYLVGHCSPVNIGILLSLYDGLRIGEVCGLQWKDVDMERGTLRVERTVIRIRDTAPDSPNKTRVLVSTPKTASSVRTIPVPKDILRLMKPYQGNGDCYILTGKNEFMEPRRLYGRYKKILKEAGLGEYRYHSLRHSFASRCVEQQFDIKSLSEIMGHSNVHTTMDLYVHPSMEYKIKQMNRLTLKKEKPQKTS